MENLDDDFYFFAEKFSFQKEYYSLFYTTSKPIKYKKLILYPVKTKYYMILQVLSLCLKASKFETCIPQCMGMNDLQYLFYSNKKENINNSQIYLPLLKMLLLLCLHKKEKTERNGCFIETISFAKDDKDKCFIIIEDEKYDWKDYQNIKEIICNQNCIDLPDYKIHPKIREKIEEKQRLLSKNKKVGSFEELVESLMVACKFSEEYILNLSIRKFIHLLERYEIFSNFYINRLLSVNMDKVDREKILNWNSSLPKEDNFYSNVQKLSEIEGKIEQLNK